MIGLLKKWVWDKKRPFSSKNSKLKPIYNTWYMYKISVSWVDTVADTYRSII